MTETSNFYIYANMDNQNEKVLAHSFANIRNPEIYEPVIMTAVKAYQLLWGVPSEDTYDIHPLCDILANKFKFLIDGMGEF